MANQKKESLGEFDSFFEVGSEPAEGEKKEKVNYTVSVTRAKVISDKKCIAFDMTANGVAIQGCFLREYTNKEGIKDYIVSFPSQKYTNGKGETKYSNYAWFPINLECKNNIIQQIKSLLG